MRKFIKLVVIVLNHQKNWIRKLETKSGSWWNPLFRTENEWVFSLKNIDTNTIPKSQLVVKVLIVLIVDQVLRKLIMNKYLKDLSHAQRNYRMLKGMLELITQKELNSIKCYILRQLFFKVTRSIGKLMLCLQQKQTQMFSNSRNVSMV